MYAFDARKTTDEMVRWVRDYFDKNGGGGPAVVGISGGKDGSVTAALCARALGADGVFGVLMPMGEQWDIGVSRELAAFLGIRHCTVNIRDGTDLLLGAIRAGGLTPGREAVVNTPARVRMAVLYAVSSVLGGRVACTSNLSERWVGYSTKFGDGAGDFGPLAWLTATEVRAVGRELGLPPLFVDKAPEDGLSGMTDEENMGFSYGVLDRYIREGVCDDPKTRERIDGMHRLGLHKLNPMPCYGFPEKPRGRSEK